MYVCIYVCMYMYILAALAVLYSRIGGGGGRWRRRCRACTRRCTTSTAPAGGCPSSTGAICTPGDVVCVRACMRACVRAHARARVHVYVRACMIMHAAVHGVYCTRLRVSVRSQARHISRIFTHARTHAHSLHIARGLAVLFLSCILSLSPHTHSCLLRWSRGLVCFETNRRSLFLSLSLSLSLYVLYTLSVLSIYIHTLSRPLEALSLAVFLVVGSVLCRAYCMVLGIMCGYNV
jgi:hypothetical protein